MQESQIIFVSRANTMVRSAKEMRDFSLQRIYGSCPSQRKRWYPLSSELVGRKVSQFVKGKFFEEFPSEISRVKIGDLWRENGEHVPLEWFSGKSSEEAFAISLFGLLGGSLKQSSTKESEFMSSRIFERVVDSINNVDVSDRNVSSAIDARTPKSQRITILEKELEFYRDRVREVEVSISAIMETPPETPLTSKLTRSSNLKSVAKSLLGPITKKREMRSVCSIALDGIQNAFNSSYGSLGAILGYGSIYGSQEHQLAVSSAISKAVEIVALNKGLKAASDLAFTPEVQQMKQIAMRVPDWLQVYVKLETKLPDNQWLANHFKLPKSWKKWVSYFIFS